MKSKFTFLSTLISITLLFSSCGIVYRTLLGVDTTPKWKSTKQITKDFDKQKTPIPNRYILDTASYYNAVISVFKNRIDYLKQDTLNMDSTALYQAKANAKNDLQPVQVRYFTKTGEPIFKMINCYVEPLFPMNWNVDSCFDNFPPQTIEPLRSDTNENLSFFVQHIKTIEGEDISLMELPPADYYAVVFWNSYMIRPSNKLFKELEKSQSNYPNQKTYFLYVNNHNASIWGLVNSEQKQSIKQQLEEKGIN